MTLTEKKSNKMTPTEQYIHILENTVKKGELSLLRSSADQELDHTLTGFDLFTGLWWPLRQKSQRAPRRQVAWMIAKLYACYPIAHSSEDETKTLARQLALLCPPKDEKFRYRFDTLLILPLHNIEPALRWALALLYSNHMSLNWVKLTDDLSIWERESVRLRWAEEFLNNLRHH